MRDIPELLCMHSFIMLEKAQKHSCKLIITHCARNITKYYSAIKRWNKRGPANCRCAELRCF